MDPRFHRPEPKENKPDVEVERKDKIVVWIAAMCVTLLVIIGIFVILGLGYSLIIGLWSIGLFWSLVVMLIVFGFIKLVTFVSHILKEKDWI
jgi:hypothetical protein